MTAMTLVLQIFGHKPKMLDRFKFWHQRKHHRSIKFIKIKKKNQISLKNKNPNKTKTTRQKKQKNNPKPKTNKQTTEM